MLVENALFAKDTSFKTELAEFVKGLRWLLLKLFKPIGDDVVVWEFEFGNENWGASSENGDCCREYEKGPDITLLFSRLLELATVFLSEDNPSALSWPNELEKLAMLLLFKPLLL